MTRETQPLESPRKQDGSEGKEKEKEGKTAFITSQSYADAHSLSDRWQRAYDELERRKAEACGKE